MFSSQVGEPAAFVEIILDASIIDKDAKNITRGHVMAYHRFLSVRITLYVLLKITHVIAC